MYVVIAVSVIALLLTWSDSIGRSRYGMSVGAFLVTLLGVLHYNYGNDYMAYLGIYEEAASLPFSALWEGEVFHDAGWFVLCKLFQPLGGFFAMVAVLTVVQNALVFRAIRRYVKREWWWLSVMVFLFSSLFLLSFSMMRQHLVMCVFLALFPIIEQRKWVRALAVLLLCTLVHASAAVLIPFVFWGYLPFERRGKQLSNIFFILFCVIIISRPLMQAVLNMFFSYDRFLAYGDTYANGETVSFGFGYLLGLIPMFLALRYMRGEHDASNKRLVAMGAAMHLVVPFASLIPLISRVSFYFQIFHIVSIPHIYFGVENIRWRRILLVVYSFMLLYSYYLFLWGSTYHWAYAEFKTIFSVL